MTMVRAARVFASICLAAIAAGTVSAQDAAKPDVPKGFEDMLDASRLPRMAGAQELFASKSTTSFVVRESVAQATEATRALLAAEGWQPYVARSGSNARHDTLAIINFRKAGQGLNVFITVAPAQGGATSIQYTPIAIENDLPLTKDATDIALAPERPRTAVPQAALEAPARPAISAAAMVDLRDLPRLAGAEERAGGSSHSLGYMVSGAVPDTIAAVRKLLGEAGWVPYVGPLERPSERNLWLKKGPQGLSIFFTTDGSNMSRSGVNMTANRLYNNVPFPADATDIVFDDRRPYLSAVAPGTVDTLLAFFRDELAASSWSVWSAADAARFPNATLEENVANGVRAYFARDKRDRQGPIQLTLQRRADGRVDVEVRVPPFARPQDLEAGQDMHGLPKPERIKSATGRDGRTHRELTALVPAELATVLAFLSPRACKAQLDGRSARRRREAGRGGPQLLVARLKGRAEARHPV
jgi:hypothetical protein